MSDWQALLFPSDASADLPEPGSVVSIAPSVYADPVSSTRRTRQPGHFTRLTRSEVTRWLAVVLLAPLLALGTLGGQQFLAHGHDEHGTHLHPVLMADGGQFDAADHADHHGHEHPGTPPEAPGEEDDGGDSDQVPNGVRVSLPGHKQLPARGMSIGKTLSLIPAAVVLTPSVTVLLPDPNQRAGPPRGLPGRGPMHLQRLSAGDRLVRTSRALLI
jgi:hypothetical protein